MPAAPANVVDLCALIVRSRLVAPEELKGALKGLKPTGSDAGDIDAARRLLVGGKHLTDYQAALLLRGHGEGFFLGPYQILELIAKGRMAGVYRANHESGQIVAIKVLPASKAKDPETLARFRREGRLLTQLDHPNVVRAFQVGEADGKSYLVLEYLEGDTLDEVLAKRKKLPPVEAVRVIHQAMLGLQHIHERGMIHRDLKPANLMLVEPPGKAGDDTLDRAVKILDIGFGKALFEEPGAAGDDASKLTADGTLMGTPDYLAPEQARSARHADIRSDVYALGCVLYHALTGQPPFPDKSVLTQVMRHATEPPRPLSDFLTEVPDGLQNVMNWLMAKDPSQRYSTPERAAQALNLFLRNTPAIKPAAAPLPAFVKWLEVEAGSEAVKASAVPTGIAVGKLEPAKGKQEPARPAEVRKPGTATAPALHSQPVQPVVLADFDVELVSVNVPEPRQQLDDEPRGLLEPNRRDLIMLCAGGGFVVTAMLAGWGLSKLLRREPPPETTPPPDTNAPQEG
jgi:eukaryotic-like serine/threonine-protein kinase